MLPAAVVCLDHTVRFSRCGSHGITLAALQGIRLVTATNRASVWACGRIMRACHPEHMSTRDNSIPHFLEISTASTQSQRRHNSNSSGTTQANLATFIHIHIKGAPDWCSPFSTCDTPGISIHPHPEGEPCNLQPCIIFYISSTYLVRIRSTVLCTKRKIIKK